MSRKFLTNIDLNKNELQQALFHKLATAPGTPFEAQFYYHTGDKTPYFHNGTAFVPLDAQKRTGIPLANLATDPLARANHTGSQSAATISDLASTVKAYRLDEFAAPTAAVSVNSQRLTNVEDPVSAQDAATMGWTQNQIQSAAAGIDCKPSVRIVSNSNITLSGTQTIDGVTLSVGDRVLVRGQTTTSQNGPYVVAAGAWSRATDGDLTGELTPGAFWFVEEGTTNARTQWRIENTGTITIGSTGITINQFNAATVYTAGNGLNLGSNSFSVVAGTGITVGANVAIDTTVVARKASATIGDGSATSFTITHNLNNQDVITQLREVSTNNVVDADIQNNGVNTVVISFAVAPASNSIRASIVG